MPGLIEGASEGVGLGHEFLAHLERARLLVHVIDATEDVAERFAAIDRELERYGAGLDALPQIVVLNKIDLAARAAGLRARRRADRRACTRVSSATGAGIEAFKRGLFELVPPARGAGGRRVRRSSSTSSSTGRARGASAATGSSAPTAASASRERRRTRPSSSEALRAAGARTGAEVEVGEETFELA